MDERPSSTEAAGVSGSRPGAGVSGSRLAAGFLLAAVLMLVPAWLAPHVAGPGALALERDVLIWFHAWQDVSPVIDRVVTESAALGEGWTMAAVAVLLGLLLWRLDRTWALAPGTAFLGTLGLHYLGKFVVGRSRPRFIEWDQQLAAGPAYPSGHALETAAVWLVVVYVVSRHAPARARPWLWAVLPPFVLLLGVNRLYLGLHWPTDVLAGWVAGAAWGVACIAAFRAGERASDAAAVRSGASARLEALG